MTNSYFTILFVDNPVKSAVFYEALLGIKPVEASETFGLFILKSGLKLGLWSRHTAEPAVSVTGGGTELAFQVDKDEEVDQHHAAWVSKGLPILQSPAVVDFGYTFLAADPDGHRLRVYAPHN